MPSRVFFVLDMKKEKSMCGCVLETIYAQVSLLISLQSLFLKLTRNL